jgi:uncharacterized protein (DUF433 family)
MKQKYISKHKEILGGIPVIVGTRIPAERLAHLIKQGYTEEKIKQEFPGLSVTKVRGALFELAEIGIKHV